MVRLLDATFRCLRSISRRLRVRVKLLDYYMYVYVYLLTSNSTVDTSRNLRITNYASAILGVIIV